MSPGDHGWLAIEVGVVGGDPSGVHGGGIIMASSSCGVGGGGPSGVIGGNPSGVKGKFGVFGTICESESSLESELATSTVFDPSEVEASAESASESESEVLLDDSGTATCALAGISWMSGVSSGTLR